jgi:hypothetical protein
MRPKKKLRELERVREDEFRELGSLALEMYRRDSFDLDLLKQRTESLAEIEAQIRQLAPDR